MKTPKEYADELIISFRYIISSFDDKCNYIESHYIYYAKRCALIALEHERIAVNRAAFKLGADFGEWHLEQLKYYDQVKEEIEKA